jgi:DNA-binding CsgD family transcriptional regulator
MSIAVHGGRKTNMSTFEALVRTIGRLDFPESLLDLVGEVNGADHFGAFVRYGDRLSAVAVGSSKNAVATKAAAGHYLERHWRTDRVWRTRPGPDGQVFRIDIDDVLDAACRHDCYAEQDVIDKLSVVRRRGAVMVCVSTFRNRRSGYFKQAEVDEFTAAADLLVTLVKRHADLMPDAPVDRSRLLSVDDAVQYVGFACPELTVRERDVCGRIAAGMSSKDIASDLWIQLDSVLTYRKRAYARLGISSQSELFSICLRAVQSSRSGGVRFGEP